MTVSNTAVSIAIPGNGSQTVFAYSFEIPYQDDGVTPAVVVTSTTDDVVTIVAGNAFTITGVGDSSGGTVLYNPGTPVPVGTTITIYRAKALTQPSAFTNQSFLPHSVEDALDTIVLEMQQLAVHAPNPVPTTIPNIPVPTNYWPDPQFCIQDANLGFLPTPNDPCTGSIPVTSVTSYTTGSNTVVCLTASTANVLVGDMVYFDAPADAVLITAGRIFRVTAIVTNVSFTVITEQFWGQPSASAACLVHTAMRGVDTSTNSGNVTSNCQRAPGGASGPTVIISDHPAHTSLFVGCKRVLVVTLNHPSAGGSIFWVPNAATLGTVAGQSRAVGAAVRVMSGSGATAQAFINNGAVVAGGVIATTSGRTWCSTQGIAGSVTYHAGIILTGPTGSSFIIGEFTECPYPGVLPDGAFSTPRAQIVMGLSSISPWVGQQITIPVAGEFTVDMRQISKGIINEGVSYMMGSLEGQSQTEGDIFNTYSAATAPILFNPILHQPGIGTDSNPLFYGFASGNFNLGADARYRVQGTAAQVWKHLSWDLAGGVLFASA